MKRAEMIRIVREELNREGLTSSGMFVDPKKRPSPRNIEGRSTKYWHLYFKGTDVPWWTPVSHENLRRIEEAVQRINKRIRKYGIRLNLIPNGSNLDATLETL